jgi:dTDP-4-dehydrorhamnose reductase
MPKKRILLIGSSGQVGWELQRCVQTLGEVVAVGRNRSQITAGYIDLANPDSIRSIIREVKPTLILNAAAYTAVDQAEQEAELAHQINGTAPGILAEESLRLNALLIHYSTDYVFNGDHTLPYTEKETVNPIGVYGTSKLAGEQAIQAVGGHYFILRTAWVYGLQGKNFLVTMQRLAKERDELKVVMDQTGTPTWSRMIAEATSQIITQLYSPLSQADLGRLSGIYHLTCAGQTSWYKFAKAIIAQCEKQPRVLPITTAEYPTPTKRPTYSVLCNAKLAETFGITLPKWDRALDLCLGTNTK